MMKRWNGLLLALALTLALSACGGAGTVSSASASAASASAPAASETDPQAELEALQSENEQLKSDNAALRAQLAADGETDNPVDTFFDEGGYWDNSTTVVMNYVSEEYRNAWQAELNHLGDAVIAGLSYDEDKEHVRDYLESVEKTVSEMDDMAPFACSDITVAPEQRASTMGTIYGTLLGGNGAQVYKNAFFQLLSVSPYSQEGGYEYVFDAAAYKAEMDAKLAN